MNGKRVLQSQALLVGLCVLLLICGGSVVLYGELLFKELTEEQKQPIREQIQEMIREAQKFSDEGKYAEALRMLFDAMYQEYQLFPEQHSPSASSELTKLESSLVHQDQSPLMQFFRDLDVPLEEKLDRLNKLREYVAHGGESDKEELFRENYGGTLVQLLKNPQLDQGEKFDVLYWIEGTIHAQYTPMVQRERIRKEIADLRGIADQKFREHQYVEAFVLINEAEQKARDIELYLIAREEDMSLSEQVIRMYNTFVQEDESSLMRQLKNRLISYREKRQLLDELTTILMKDHTNIPDTVVFHGKEYNGTLVQILNHPKIRWLTKYTILEHLKEAIKKDSLIP